MELLLLDTTEREGEDNKLYHFCAHPSAGSDGKRTASTWRGLRGVLAAAVGTTASVCGEPLQCAHFTSTTGTGSIKSASSSAGEMSDLVGFVNLYEVLYVLVFPATAGVPIALVQYYTHSSCDLLLSLFGFPDAKLRAWMRGSDDTLAALTARLDALFTGVFAVIKRDLAGGTHLQFAFDGRVPVVHYPLDALTELAVLEALEPLDNAVVAGRCIRFRKCVVLSTIRPDMLRLVNQWLVAPSSPFRTLASFASTTALDGYIVTTYELHDARFARHGRYPKRHTLLVLERDDLQVLYVVEKALAPTEDAEKPISRALVQRVDTRVLAQLVQVATTGLPAYLTHLQAARARALTASRLPRPSSDSQTSDSPKLPEQQQHTDTRARFLSYVVVHDLLRDVIIGERFDTSACCVGTLSAEDAAVSQQQTRAVRGRSAHAEIFSLFADRVAALQQIAIGPRIDAVGASKRLDEPTWVTPLQLDVSDPNTLFLHEASVDAGADISAEDTHVFPPYGETLVTASPALEQLEALVHRRLVHQEAESHAIAVDAQERQRLWIVANYYETIRAFAVFDAASVTLATIEQEVDRLCVFGGATRADGTNDSGRSG